MSTVLVRSLPSIIHFSNSISDLVLCFVQMPHTDNTRGPLSRPRMASTHVVLRLRLTRSLSSFPLYTLKTQTRTHRRTCICRYAICFQFQPCTCLCSELEVEIE